MHNSDGVYFLFSAKEKEKKNCRLHFLIYQIKFVFTKYMKVFLDKKKKKTRNSRC